MHLLSPRNVIISTAALQFAFKGSKEFVFLIPHEKLMMAQFNVIVIMLWTQYSVFQPVILKSFRNINYPIKPPNLHVTEVKIIPSLQIGKLRHR